MRLSKSQCSISHDLAEGTECDLGMKLSKSPCSISHDLAEGRECDTKLTIGDFQ